jgi:hypothetical protein
VFADLMFGRWRAIFVAFDVPAHRGEDLRRSRCHAARPFRSA